MTGEKILDVIDEMTEYIDGHGSGPLSKDKIKISRDKLFDYIDELRQAVKTEIAEIDKMFALAERRAAKIEAAAKEKMNSIIKDDEIVIAAEKEADFIIENAEIQSENIIRKAEETSRQITIGALSYAEEMLASVEETISTNLELAASTSNSVIESLKNTLSTVKGNRNELKVQIDGATASDKKNGKEEEEFNVEVDETYFETMLPQSH